MCNNNLTHKYFLEEKNSNKIKIILVYFIKKFLEFCFKKNRGQLNYYRHMNIVSNFAGYSSIL